jgi:hypothetical protein
MLGGGPPATIELQEPRRSFGRLLLARALRLELAAVALWLALGAGLAVITSRVVDWYVMTDELLYERLAINIAHFHSPLPRVHGELIANVNQLYPLLLAPVFRDSLVPEALHDAHVLNAFVMSSACVPAFLLARRVTQRRSLSYLAATLSVCIPWIALSSFLLTEVIAYPVFLWAMLALQRSAVLPRPRNDVLVLLALALAVLARTQFALLFVVLPFTLVLHHFAFSKARSAPLRIRLRASGRELVSAHRVLVGAYAALAAAAIALAGAGRLSSVLGTYSVTAEGNLFPHGFARSLLEHLATVSLGVGVLPFVVGAAWLMTTLIGAPTRELHAFASLATLTIAALLLEVTSYDLRFGAGRMHDRYLFYVVPLVLIGLAAALRERRWPRWSLFVPAGLIAVGFSLAPVRSYEKFNVDSPVSVVNNRLIDLGGSMHGAQLILGLGTIVMTVLFLQASVLLRGHRLAALLVGITVLVLPAETGYAFTRLLTVDGTSGRPITHDQGVVFNWIDRTVGPRTKVTMVPYPMLYGDYWSNVAYWWDLEFWNASVQRAAVYQGALSWTNDTFPKTTLVFDPSTGSANVSPSRYAAESVAETRFRIAGKPVTEYRGVLLIETEQPWRTEWMTFGLYDDGWTVPRAVTRIRIFAAPDQTKPAVRYLTISARAPRDIGARIFHVSSNMTDWRGKAVEGGTSKQFPVCVPAHSFADVSLSTRGYTPIYGDPKSEETFASYARSGGVMLTQISLADEMGSC